MKIQHHENEQINRAVVVPWNSRQLSKWWMNQRLPSTRSADTAKPVSPLLWGSARLEELEDVLCLPLSWPRPTVTAFVLAAVGTSLRLLLLLFWSFQNQLIVSWRTSTDWQAPPPWAGQGLSLKLPDSATPNLFPLGPWLRSSSSRYRYFLCVALCFSSSLTPFWPIP